MSAVWPARAQEPQAPSRTIPFDYSFHFELAGKRDRSHRKAVVVSVEAAFTAVSIGYGVVPELQSFEFGPGGATDGASGSSAAADEAARRAVSARRFAAAVASTGVAPPAAELNAATAVANARTAASLGATAAAVLARPPIAQPIADIRFDEVFDGLERAARQLEKKGELRRFRDEPPIETALRAGIRINPRLLYAARFGKAGSLDRESLKELFQVVVPPPQYVPFLYALFDEGSGREFQSEPVLSIAGLGAPDGGRPFRHFAHPISFAPLTTIRMDVIEQTDVRGDLFVSLHGYKVLGGPRPAEAAREPHRAARHRR